jgi:hypothetical protein
VPVVLTCHAGCDTGDVLRALGWTWADLYADGNMPAMRARLARRSRSSTDDLPIDTDRRFGAVPPGIILNACPICVQLFAYLAWRCGKNNAPQRGIANIAAKLGVQPRTLAAHAEALAGAGWIDYHAEVTDTGSRRSAVLVLRHLPALHITNPDVHRPGRKHGTYRAERATPDNDLGAIDAPPEARSTHQDPAAPGATDAPRLRSWRYEHGGTRSSAGLSRELVGPPPDICADCGHVVCVCASGEVR